MHIIFTYNFLKGSNGYKSGFNGKENIDEIDGWQDYGERMYNRMIGRFPTADPLIVYQQKYPWYSPYQFAGNKPIIAVDLDGLEEFIVTREFINGVVVSRTIFVLPEFRTIPTGVRYRFRNEDGTFTIRDYDDFIQGSKESTHRTNNLPYYLSKSNAQNQTETRYGPLGRGNQIIAQGNWININGNVDLISGQRETYNTPILQEFYATNSSTITTQSINAGSIADYLIANPTYTASVNAYTDRVGNDVANLNLSIDRANGIRQAIIDAATNSGNYSNEQIVDLSNRIIANGFGENLAAARGAPDGVENSSDRTTSVVINRP